MKRPIISVAIIAVAALLALPTATYATPTDTFTRVGAALKAQGMTLCDKPWAKATRADSTERGVHASRLAHVIAAPGRPCPKGEDRVDGIVSVIVYKNPEALAHGLENHRGTSLALVLVRQRHADSAPLGSSRRDSGAVRRGNE